MRIWRRNAVVAVVVLFVCVALYLSWSYNRGTVEELMGEDVYVDVSDTGDVPSLEPEILVETNDGSDLVNDSIEQSSGYFTEERLNRQIARDSALTILKELSDKENLSEDERVKANNEISELAAHALTEAKIEGLVVAKGFTDCVAYINESGISIVVAPVDQGLTATDVVKIKDIVLSETTFEATNVTVIEAKAG